MIPVTAHSKLKKKIEMRLKAIKNAKIPTLEKHLEMDISEALNMQMMRNLTMLMKGKDLSYLGI